MILDREQIQTIIPHREPMLLLDGVRSLEPGRQARAFFRVGPEREIFRGHFPGEPVLPGVYTVEAVAQAADVLLLSTPRYAGKVPLFLGIDGVRFHRKIIPGETLEITVELLSERPDKAIATCAGQVHVGGELAAVAKVTLALR